MPRHSPILQILLYFYSKQEKCNIYLYIFIYILKPVTKNKKNKKNNIHVATLAFRKSLKTNLKKMSKTHTHTYYFTLCTCINTVNVFKTECTKFCSSFCVFLIFVRSLPLLFAWLSFTHGIFSLKDNLMSL